MKSPSLASQLQAPGSSPSCKGLHHPVPVCCESHDRRPRERSAITGLEDTKELQSLGWFCAAADATYLEKNKLRIIHDDPWWSNYDLTMI